MRTYNQQIEDAYAASKRQGDMMRNRQIERSSSQDRRNRYRSDLYEVQSNRAPFDGDFQDDGRVDRYGFERSSMTDRIPGDRDNRGRGPKNYRRSDERIRDEINDRLTDDPYVDATEVEVTVVNGGVRLSGSVEDRDAKRRAEEITETVLGVGNVENSLRISEQK